MQLLDGDLTMEQLTNSSKSRFLPPLVSTLNSRMAIASFVMVFQQ
jgi:hypothetical protein